MNEIEIGNFMNDLESLCSHYGVKITTFCDSITGEPHACFHERNNDNDYYNIDNEAGGLVIGEKLQF